jgi:hypothetical protein
MKPMAYLLRVQKAKGPVLTFNGKSFANRKGELAKIFATTNAANTQGKKLLKQFPILKDYRMWVDSELYNKSVAKKGRTKKNPLKRDQAALDDAARLLEDFSGHSVGSLESAYSRSDQKTGLIVGELDLIGYRAKRDGKTERYGHHFKKNSRPLLAVTSDGKQLHIVGGQYEFTEAGIEDR